MSSAVRSGRSGARGARGARHARRGDRAPVAIQPRHAAPAAASSRRPARVLLVAATAGALVVGAAGGAAAYWRVGGSGTSNAATTASAGVTLSASAGTASGLYPGGPSQQVTVTVTNPGSKPVTVTTVTVGAVGSDKSGCSTAQVTATDRTSVVVTVPALLPTVAAGGTGAVALTVTMPSGAATECQAARFTIPVTVTGRV